MSDVKTVNLNRSQSLIHVVNANVTHCLWPRGGGKTEGGIGPRMLHLSQVMPRSQHIFYSDTYERIHDRLIPNIINFLTNQMGLIEGLDFVKFKKPPANWVKPLIEPTKYDHVIPFATGFTICCASAKVEGSANGYNAQSATVDENKFVPEQKVKGELLRALRGNFNHFGHLPEYRSYWTFTDKYEGDIRWVLKIRDEQRKPMLDNQGNVLAYTREDLVNAVYSMQLEVYRLTEEMGQYQSAEKQYQYKRRITQIEAKLSAIRKELVWVCDAKPYENMDVLGEKYYRDQKRDCKTTYEYDIAVGNKDPDKPEHAFYHAISDANIYRRPLAEVNRWFDVVHNRPMVLTADFNWRIVPLVLGQVAKRPGSDKETLNVIGSTHVLYPGKIEDAVSELTTMCKGLPNRTIYFAYDHTAIGKDPRGITFKDDLINKLKAARWIVIEVYIGQAPPHDAKYRKLNELLAGLQIMINGERNQYLLNALYKAKTKTSSGKTEKDKDDEKNLNIPAEETTDYTDAFDTLPWATLVMKLVRSVSAPAGGTRLT